MGWVSVFTKKVLFSLGIRVFILLIALQTQTILASDTATVVPDQETIDRVAPVVERFTGEKLDDIMAKADHYSSDEFLHPILHAKEIRQDRMREFRDKLLYTIPLKKIFKGLPEVGIYTKDALKAATLCITLAYQKILLNSYKQHLAQQFADHLITNRETIVPQLNNYNSSVVHACTPKKLYSWYQDIKLLGSSSCFMKHSYQAIARQFIAWYEQRYLLHESDYGVKSGQPLPIFSLVKVTAIIELFVGIPLATGSNAIIQFAKRHNMISPWCDNVFLVFAKDLALSLVTLHKLTGDLTKKQWPEIFSKSYNQIGALLSNYEGNQQQIRSDLEFLIYSAIDIPLKQWLKKKYASQAFWDGCYHATFLVPTIYRVFNTGYGMYKEVTS